jgi:exosortase A
VNHYVEEFRATPQLAPLVLLLLLIPAIFWSTTAAMADVWITNETFTHGFLILPISLWLIWEQRHSLRSVQLARDPRALLFLLPTLALWFLATLIDVAIVQQLAMVAMIPLTVWWVLGLPLTLALLFPLCYLFFSVPLGQSLIPPMMEFTADMAVSLVQRSGVPIYRDGLSFELPTGRWAVVEECSGVRYLIASAALGTIYAYITYRSTMKRVLFVIASLIVPIIANGLRAYGIVMIGHLSGMQYAVGADHLLYGWVFFGIVIFVLFWVGGFWADRDAPPPADDTAAAASASAETGRWSGRAMLALGVLLAVSFGTQALKSGSDATLDGNASLAIEVSSDTWTPVDTQRGEDDWQPVHNNPDLSATQAFRSATGEVIVDVAYFHRQRENAEAISSLNRHSDPYEGDWKLTAQRRAGNGSAELVETELTYRARKVLVWSAYLVGDRYFASASLAKLYQAQRLLRGRHDAAWVTLATDFDAPLPELQARLASLWPALAPALADAVRDLQSPP